ncbi:hypothetical protein EX30DRAFT_367309 [Ascodesmis nigricans]|uniref:AAA+ ATPase domain-containing protein n=1 Tax=Ascodesmis nigricans TaxID=341454 RepID=A0A4S2MIF9_9PEZI|nr:hypothetical protein EX30DRAFT_367309 [Ascodesmis nigricans]
MPPTSLTITNPLHLYRAHIAASRLLPDPAQHRIAHHLQSVYHRLLNYTPPPELNSRLASLSLALSTNNPPPPTILHELYQSHQSRSLIRVVTSADTAVSVPTPQGFYLHGEVGTGKSLLLDLLYSSLPHTGKRRWHFHAFMLMLFESLAKGGEGHEHILLSIARDLVEQTPIVFLDEIQFPDRASAKITSELLVRFWALGGVLVGSSNRATKGLMAAAGTGRRGEFVRFEDALQARCEEHRIEGSKDWRREKREGPVKWWRVGSPLQDSETQSSTHETHAPPSKITKPSHFYAPDAASEAWKELTTLPPGATWEPKTITVYGRQIHLPRHHAGKAIITFSDLCNTNLGPADYLTLCSTLHTLLIISVPALSHAKNKNEARRFITLLDAVYESGVKLALQTTAEMTPDELLFPDLQASQKKAGGGERQKGEYDMTGDADSLHGEVFAEAWESGAFRPNVLNTPAEDAERVEEAMRETARSKVDYSNQRAFTGEDEVFAARRAVSRIWEVCGDGWWSGVEWTPVVRERERERGGVVDGVGGVGVRDTREKPVFGERHFWSMGLWGKRAGDWGRGVDAKRQPS